MDNKTVGPKEGLGFGILGLGLLLAFLPSAAQQIADLDFVASDPFTISIGAIYVIGALVIVAGLVVAFGSYDKE